jgi:5,6-dimethylbenzimidazole synthase
MVDSRESVTFDEPFRTAFRTLLAWRRDVRRFKPDPLPPEIVPELVRIAATAPSVGYSQPWRFVEIADPTRRAAVTAEYERANAAASDAYDGERRARYRALKLAGLREAPVHLAAFADRGTLVGSGLGRATMPEMLEYSVVTAVFTLWLAARAMGIGVGWVSIFDPERVTAILDVPPSWRLVAYLCVGYPVEEHDDRELARAGWEAGDPEAIRIHRR